MSTTEVAVRGPQIQEYSRTAAALADLRQRFKGMIYEVATPAGMAEAKKARAEVRGYRIDLEKKRVEIKAPALERSRLIDTEAKEITAELVALEGPIDEQIKTEEKRLEDERQAKIDAERRSVETIRGAIAEIQRSPIYAIGKPAADIRALLDELASRRPTEAVFQEQFAEAMDAWDKALAQLRELVAAAERNAAESERLRVEREDQAAERKRLDDETAAAEKTRKENEERDRAQRDQEDRDRRAKLEADERAAADIRAKADQEAREKREREDREAAAAREKADADAATARAAEEKRLNAIAAENERVAAENRRKEDEARAEHNRQVNAKLAGLRGDKAMGKFMAAALDYRCAEQDQATEKLVALCEIYGKRKQTAAEATA